MDLRLLTVITMLIAPAPLVAKEPEKITPVYRSQSSAYIQDSKEGSALVTENHVFDFQSIRNENGDGWEATLLLEETFSNVRWTHTDWTRGQATINAWTIKPGHPRRPRWTIHADANEGRIWDQFLRLTTWGCCGTPPAYSYYNLSSGKLVFFTNSDLLEIRGGEGFGSAGARFVGFGFRADAHSGETPCLQYGSGAKEPESVSVISSWTSEALDLPELFLEHEGQRTKGLNLIGSPYSFTVVIRYPDGASLLIPIEDDHFCIEKAVLPDGFSLRKTPAAAP